MKRICKVSNVVFAIIFVLMQILPAGDVFAVRKSSNPLNDLNLRQARTFGPHNASYYTYLLPVLDEQALQNLQHAENTIRLKNTETRKTKNVNLDLNGARSGGASSEEIVRLGIDWNDYFAFCDAFNLLNVGNNPDEVTEIGRGLQDVMIRMMGNQYDENFDFNVNGRIDTIDIIALILYVRPALSYIFLHNNNKLINPNDNDGKIPYRTLFFTIDGKFWLYNNVLKAVESRIGLSSDDEDFISVFDMDGNADMELGRFGHFFDDCTLSSGASNLLNKMLGDSSPSNFSTSGLATNHADNTNPTSMNEDTALFGNLKDLPNESGQEETKQNLSDDKKNDFAKTTVEEKNLEDLIYFLENKENKTELENEILEAARRILEESKYIDEEIAEEFEEMVRLDLPPIVVPLLKRELNTILPLEPELYSLMNCAA